MTMIRETAGPRGNRMLIARDVYAVQFAASARHSEEWRIVFLDLPQASVPNEAAARAWLEFLAHNTIPRER